MLASERFELLEAGLPLADQLRHVEAEGRRFELFESGGAVAQQAGGSAPVAVLQVVEADAHLQDALVEITDASGLVHPGLFEILVALEELAPVEFLYAPEDEVRQFLGRFTGRPPRPTFRHPQPHPPPQHPPPPLAMRASITGFVDRADAPGVMEAKLEITRLDSVEPHSGQPAGSSASLIGRMRSKRSSHSAHLYS